MSFKDRVSQASSDMIEAAAASTQQSCSLLGVKSLGVDYGLVRTGVGVTVGYEPRPVTILSDLNATQTALEVVKYCASEQAKRIIVGLPLHKNGTEAPQSSLTRDFASQLACLVMAQLGPNIAVYMWDERYTSKEAAARVHSEDPDRKLHKTLDADAACIILENYYHENGNGAEQVLVPEDMKELCMRAWKAQQLEETQRKQSVVDQRESRSQRRQEAMERARKLEEKMTKDGTLGKSRKKKRKKR